MLRRGPPGLPHVRCGRSRMFRRRVGGSFWIPNRPQICYKVSLPRICRFPLWTAVFKEQLLMKKYFALILILALAAVWSVRTVTTSAQSEKRSATDPLVSPNIVISQLYGGGGASGAQYTNDFVELFNRGNTATAINGWSVQYASAGGTNWIVNNLPNATIQPGQYFLIQFASEGNVGNPLPTPDFIAPAVTVNGSTFILNMSRTTG